MTTWSGYISNTTVGTFSPGNLNELNAIMKHVLFVAASPSRHEFTFYLSHMSIRLGSQ